jgi:AAA15 family ATPase/GTPase
MRIQSLEVRRFRSIEKTVLTNCGGSNVLIGKNNAGKSNILSTIEVRVLSRTGCTARPKIYYSGSKYLSRSARGLRQRSTRAGM